MAGDSVQQACAKRLDLVLAISYSPPVMTTTFRTLLFCTTVLWATVLWSGSIVYADSVLLLRNGNVLSGEITPQDEYFLVKLPTGEIRIRESQVELACRDLEDGYQQKHAAVREGSAQDHVDLARWCLRQRLLDFAVYELSEARRLEPDHPRIAVLERHLTMARQASQKIKPSVRKPLPLRRVATGDELDKMVRSLPKGTLETFATTVQPVLLNHCSTVGCHGPRGDSHLYLEKIPTLRNASRRPTQRNLHAILKLIDRGAPDRSPLLTYPIRSHGGTEEPVFTQRNSEPYQHLIEWVQRLAEPKATPSTVASIRPGVSVNEKMRTRPLRQPQSVVPIGFESPVRFGSAE